jgi:hypothetical protein
VPDVFLGRSPFDSIGSLLVSGRRQNGDRVGDVVLPPWATNSADFIRKMRDALESECVLTPSPLVSVAGVFACSVQSVRCWTS